jgi:hypothetical protein
LQLAELLYSWSRIDPEVVKAVTFAEPSAHISGVWDFIGFVDSHFAGLGSAGAEHAYDRLLGYVGEQQYYELMVSHGHAVTRALTANQPVWDFIVDGHPVNVKTYADISPLHATAEQHPYVTYAVPADAHGTVGENMVRVDGLSHDHLTQQFSEAIARAKGETAAHAFGVHLPIATVCVATWRGACACRAGQQLGLAVRYGLIDVVTKGSGAVAGVVGGLKLGLLTGSPVGVLVGSVAGAFAGSLAGTEIGRRWKERPLTEAEAALDEALRQYWASCSDPERVSDLIEDELRARRYVRDRWRDAERHAVRSLDNSLVTVVQSTVKLADEAVTVAEEDSDRLLPVLKGALDGEVPKATAVGALLANCPEVADWLNADPSALDNLRQARLRCLQEREKLYFGTTPLATADAVIGRARFGIPVVHLNLDGYFHSPSVRADADLNSQCPELNWELEEPRQTFNRKRSSSFRLVRAGADKFRKDINSGDLGRVVHNRMPPAKPCPYCGHEVLSAHRDRVQVAGMRIGWHVDPDQAVWLCDSHGEATCTSCHPGI